MGIGEIMLRGKGPAMEVASNLVGSRNTPGSFMQQKPGYMYCKHSSDGPLHVGSNAD